MAALIPAPSVRCKSGITIRPALARNPLLLAQRGVPASRRGGSIRYRGFSVKASAVSRLEDLLNLDVSPYTDKIIAEYIWIGGSGIDVRSKSRTISKAVEHPSELPKWNYDGSSTGQAPGEDSEVILYPQAIFKDPFRGGNNILVMCDSYTPNGEPIPTNKRYRAAQIFSDPKVVAEVPWFGIEQEYTLLQSNVKWPLGWPIGGYPGPQGPYYCSAGADKSFGRDISDAHYKACLYAGINISGTNGEVMPGQWEYQVGPSVGIDAGDHIWVSRYILERITEQAGVVLSLDPKPIEGDWNGAAPVLCRLHEALALPSPPSSAIFTYAAVSAFLSAICNLSPAMEAEVVYLCKRTVVSSLSMWPGELHRLSVLDCTMEPYSLRAVYYYPRCPPAAGTISKLKESLAELLNTYRPVSGRLHRTAEGRWAVKCNDAGVRIVEATAKGSVEEWLRTVEREKEMKLIFWEDMYRRSNFWSTFYIQLTQFEGGGLAIAISCAHMLADAVCLSALVTAWADMNLLGKMLSPPCFHPLPPPRVGGAPTRQHPPSRALVDHYATSMESESPEAGGFATATFAFSDEMVRSILAEAQAADDGATAPSVFVALAALFWAAVSRAKGKDRGLVDMTVCMDARKALNLSRSFFGNAMVFAGVRGGEIGGSKLEVAAKAIADATKAIDYEGVAGLMEWLDSRTSGEGTGGPALRLCGQRLVCANWEGLSPHLATFEQGLGPIHVSYYLEPVTGEGHILVLPQPREESLGRVVAVTLPEAQLERLREDGHILRYQPKTLMSPSRANI